MIKTVTKSIIVLLVTTIVSGSAQNSPSDDVAAVNNNLTVYHEAIERLDTTSMSRLFMAQSMVIESGKNEGRFSDYLTHHLGPELREFTSFTFSDYRADVTVDLPYAFAIETYKYTIILKKDGSKIERKGVATTVLKKENGSWKIWQIHSSSRK